MAFPFKIQSHTHTHEATAIALYSYFETIWKLVCVSLGLSVKIVFDEVQCAPDDVYYLGWKLPIDDLRRRHTHTDLWKFPFHIYLSLFISHVSMTMCIMYVWINRDFYVQFALSYCLPLAKGEHFSVAVVDNNVIKN